LNGGINKMQELRDQEFLIQANNSK
jgi:hypothetical protein